MRGQSECTITPTRAQCAVFSEVLSVSSVSFFRWARATLNSLQRCCSSLRMFYACAYLKLHKWWKKRLTLTCLNTLGLIWANFLNWKKGRRTHFILSVFSACLSTIQYPVKRYLIAYLIQSLQPFSVMEQPSFQDLLQNLQPNASLMSRTTLRRKIECFGLTFVCVCTCCVGNITTITSLQHKLV